MDELRLRVTTRGDEEEAGTEFTEDENNGLATASSTPVNSRHTRKKEQFILNAIKLKTMIESILPPLTMLKSRYETTFSFTQVKQDMSFKNWCIDKDGQKLGQA